MKHNKKRNTAFLYECLIRELTKAIIKEDKQKQTKVKGLLREFFTKGKVLAQELDLYKSLLESKELNQDFSRRLMVETKKDFDGLDRKQIFNEQTSLINKINKALGNKTFSNFVPNYKDLATIGLYFQNSSLGAKKRIMLEDKVVNYLTRLDENQTEMKPVDQLEFKMFAKRFNETYEHSLLREQKDLLSNFIVSFSDNGLGLKSFMNEEIGRLKEAVNVEISKESAMSENFKKVKEKLDSYVRRPIDSQMVEEVFYIQDLLAEVKRSGN
jgi:hypothetical protein|tara:strand:+ start:836 stop:1645 length:810 start_codon:yes stop_codon:yes gene_type:complete